MKWTGRDRSNGIRENRKRRPRVLFVGPYPPPYAGPEIVMKGFVDSSLQEQFDIALLKTNVRTSNANKGRLDVTIVKAFFRFIFLLAYRLVTFRPSIVFYPVTATQLGWIGRDLWCLAICRIFRTPVIIHLQASHFQQNLARFHPLVRRLVRVAANWSQLGLVQADCLRGQFAGLLDPARVGVLHNSVDGAEFENPEVGNYDPRMVFFMAHLTKAKGYCDVVRAIPIVATRFPDVRFVFAGTIRRGEPNVFFDQTNGNPIEYEDPFEAHASIKKGPYARNYEYLGILSGNDKVAALRRASIFVMPSYAESFSCSLLEAMAVGKPVVTTPVGANREIIRDGVNGLLVPPGDHRAIADAICLLLSDELGRDRMGKENYRYVRVRFAQSEIIGALSSYLQLASIRKKKAKSCTPAPNN